VAQAVTRSAEAFITGLDFAPRAPGAPTYSLNYLRIHPEISAESIPWHIHSDMMAETAGPKNGK
jgi:hypothetical protein